MTVNSRCRALSHGDQCLDNAEEGRVFCEWHQEIIDRLLVPETPEILRWATNTVLDDSVSQRRKEYS